MDASIWTYPWDLHDEGMEAALRRIRDDGGLTGISLAASYHTTKALLPHNPRRKVYFNEGGAVEFTPRPERYGRIRPRPSRLATEANVWEEAARLTEALGLALNAWVICAHGTGLGLAYPECTLRNAFGDQYIHSLCPSHPDVRAYLIGLTTDIAAQFPVAALELESVEYMGLRHNYHHEKISIPMDAWHTFLMDLCFCEHCAQAARDRGLDVAGLQARVRDALERYFDADLPTPITDESLLEATRWALEADDFRGYLAMRGEIVTSLVAEIKRSVAREAPSTKLLYYGRPFGGWRDGSDFSALRRLVDGFITPNCPTGRETIAAIRRMRLALGDDVPLVASIEATLPQTEMSGDVTERVRAVLDEGIGALTFYNYGLMRPATLRAIGRALS